MKLVDIHVHCDSLDPEKIEVLADTARRNSTCLAMIAYVRNGDGTAYPDYDAVLDICRKHPDCFFPAAQLDLWDKADPEQVPRLRDKGFRMLKCIYPYYEYDHDLYMPVYEAAETHGLPVIFHTGCLAPHKLDRVYRRPMLRNQDPLTLDRVCRSFPGLKVIMAHLGTSMFRHQAAELLKRFDNLYADLAGSGSYMCITPDELRVMLRPALRHFDPDFVNYKKLVLGSDAYVTYPQNVTAAQFHYRRLLNTIGVPAEVQDLIMGGTAAKWLGISMETPS